MRIYLPIGYYLPQRGLEAAERVQRVYKFIRYTQVALERTDVVRSDASLARCDVAAEADAAMEALVRLQARLVGELTAVGEEESNE
jgi:hypothetical protein